MSSFEATFTILSRVRACRELTSCAHAFDQLKIKENFKLCKWEIDPYTEEDLYCSAGILDILQLSDDPDKELFRGKIKSIGAVPVNWDADRTCLVIKKVDDGKIHRLYPEV